MSRDPSLPLLHAARPERRLPSTAIINQSIRLITTLPNHCRVSVQAADEQLNTAINRQQHSQIQNV